MRTNLSKEHQMIIDIVSKFKGIDIRQLYLFMNGIKNEDVDILINMLEKKNLVTRYKDSYILPYGESSVSRDTIDCIWAMIILGEYHLDIDDVIYGSKPVSYITTINNKTSYEMIHLNTSKLIYIRSQQDKLLAKYKQFENIIDEWTVFIVEDKEVVQKIKTCNLEFPFIVAFIKEYKDGIPQFKFYKANIPNKENDTNSEKSNIQNSDNK